MTSGLTIARTALVASVGLAVAGFATLRPIDTTFNVTASTETVSIRLDSATTTRLELDGALVFRDTVTRGTPHRGTVVIPPGAFLAFERVSSGPLRIAIASEGAGITVLDSAQRAVSVPVQHLVIRVDEPAALAHRGQSLVAAFTGQVDLGAEVGQTPQRAMLREARVNLLGHTVLGDRLYEAGRVELDPGDRLSVAGGAPAVGFVTTTEQAGMTVVYRTRGRSAQVSRFGASGYQIATSLRARVLNDGTIQGLWATFFALLGVWAKVRQRKQPSPEGA